MISICPVTLLVGGRTIVGFGFAASFNIVLTIFLQDPRTMGGYGLTPTQNADRIAPCPFLPQSFTKHSWSSSGPSLGCSQPRSTVISLATVFHFGNVVATAVFGSLNSASNLYGSLVSLFYLWCLASSAGVFDIACTVWS